MMKLLYRKCTSCRALVNIALALCLAAITCFSACDTDNTTRFSHHRAFLRFAPVAAVPTLSASVRGVGEWCAITYDASHYIFTNAHQRQQQYPLTSLDTYGRPLSIAGFVVGTPALPDLSGRQTIVAFDLVCPSCYQSAYVERRLSWVASSPGALECGRCQRRYDLNNGGVVSVTKSDDQPNVPLFRYSAAYSGNSDALVVQN